MSDAGVVHARYEAFAEGFLVPLLRGGATRVERPLSPMMLAHFEVARPTDDALDRSLYDALHAAASELAPVRRIPYPDRGALAIAMAAHDLLLLTDPALDRAFARGARPTILGWVDALLEAAGPPRTRGAALARHPVVDRLLELRREDVVVKNWVSTYRFAGRLPPWNVVAVPRLRRVRESREQKPVTTLFGEVGEEAELDLGARVARMIAASPATHLVRLGRDGVPGLGAAALGLLEDPSLRGGVARALAARGFARSAEALGLALGDLHRRRTPGPLLAPLAALCIEVGQLGALDARLPELPVRAAGPGLELFLAFLVEVAEAPGALAPWLELPPPDAARFDLLHARFAAGIESDVRTYARGLVDRASGAAPAAPHPEARP